MAVEQVLNTMKQAWPEMKYTVENNSSHLHEAALLRLDCTKANTVINWHPVWDMTTGIIKTTNWYKTYYNEGRVITGDDLSDYINDAHGKGIIWTH
jgi:CDP-glucose 4,6-dehydratase